MTDEEIINLTREAGWSGICTELIDATRRKSIFTPTSIEQIRRFVELVLQTKQTPLTDAQIDDLVAKHVRITDQNLSGAVYMAMRDLETLHGIQEQE